MNLPTARSGPALCPRNRNLLSRWGGLVPASFLLLTSSTLVAPQSVSRRPELPPGLESGSFPGEFQGSLVIVGGGPLPDSIRDRFRELAGGAAARIVVIPTASEKADVPEQIKNLPRWKVPDVAEVTLLHTRRREEADDPAFAKPLSEATGVWLSGGDQSRLTAAYHGTNVERQLREVLRRGGVIGGTSAGAAVMSNVMITGGIQTAQIGPGFGLLPGVVFDQHFRNRRREERLLSVLSLFPHCPGIGVDEQTAAIIHGHTLQVLGKARVSVCVSPVSIERLRSGEELDLQKLCHDLHGRSD